MVDIPPLDLDGQEMRTDLNGLKFFQQASQIISAFTPVSDYRGCRTDNDRDGGGCNTPLVVPSCRCSFNLVVSSLCSGAVEIRLGGTGSVSVEPVLS